jgi:hypothetical protein
VNIENPKMLWKQIGYRGKEGKENNVNKILNSNNKSELKS